MHDAESHVAAPPVDVDHAVGGVLGQAVGGGPVLSCQAGCDRVVGADDGGTGRRSRKPAKASTRGSHPP